HHNFVLSLPRVGSSLLEVDVVNLWSYSFSLRLVWVTRRTSFSWCSSCARCVFAIRRSWSNFLSSSSSANQTVRCLSVITELRHRVGEQGALIGSGCVVWSCRALRHSGFSG